MQEAKVVAQTLVGILLFMVFVQPEAAAVFQCKSPQGAVVFSQKPCSLKKSTDISRKTKSAQEDAKQKNSSGATIIDGKLFDSLPAAEGEILKIVGRPAASYIYKGTGHWFYANAVKLIKGENYSPELLFKEGMNYQINWLPENLMHRTAKAAQTFSGWSEPGAIQRKTFTLQAIGVEGKTKSEVVAVLDEPDAKRVVSGIEVWEYDLVPLSKGNSVTVQVVLDFEGDKAVKARGK